MKEETVFKVVRNVGGVLISAVRGPVCLAYRIGKPTEACSELPEAGPLAFVDYESARKFAKFETRMAYLYGKDDHFEVYAAKAEGVRGVRVLSRNMTPERRREFWQDPSQFGGVDVMDAPPGSVVTRSLTLVKKVWDSKDGDVK